MKPSHEIFGSLFIASTEFALSATALQEVVDLPEKLIPVPLGPTYLLGVLNLRGVILPIVDLSQMLKLAPDPEISTKKIAVIEHDRIKIGVVFDRTGEVVRVACDPATMVDLPGAAEAKVVSGILKLDGGARILQILDPKALVHVSNAAHVLEKQKTVDHALKASRRRIKCISFQSRGSTLGLEISGIHEILKVPEVEHSDLSSELCLGRITVRGQVIPIIDFAQFLKPDAPSGNRDLSDKRIIILRIGQDPVGFVVDSVDSITSYGVDEVIPVPVLSTFRSSIIEGCIDQPGGEQVILLNLREVLQVEELRALAVGHRKLYESHVTTASAKSAKQVFITFNLQQLFGVPISKVSEIIDDTSELVHTVGLPTCVKGILNLRGDLIPVIDPCKLYDLEPLAASEPKILIFKLAEKKFGLVVDGVEAILSVMDHQKMSLPKILNPQVFEKFKDDVTENLQVTDGEGRNFTMLVLNTDQLSRRVG